MSFLDKIGAAVGIGGVSLQLDVPGEFHQGEDAPGRLRIVGGKIEQHVQRLTVRLVCYWDETETYRDDRGDTHSRTVTVSEPVSETRIDGPGPVKSGDDLTSEFQLAVPADCRLSGGTYEYKVEAAAEVPNAVDPTDTVDVAVGPPIEAMDMAEVVERELGWKRTYMGESSDPRGAVQFTFAAPTDMEKYYDELRLHVLAGEHGLEIRAVFDLQEKGWKDYLKAAVGKDNKEERFRLKYDDIYDNDDQPLAEPMVEQLRGFIEKYKS